jgi:hypothetical protein
VVFENGAEVDGSAKRGADAAGVNPEARECVAVKRLGDLRRAGGLGADAAVSEKDERLTENYDVTIQNPASGVINTRARWRSSGTGVYGSVMSKSKLQITELVKTSR